MFASERPTLPPLNSLLLPTPSVCDSHDIPSSNTTEPFGAMAQSFRRGRRASISSSGTSSRTPSLSPPPSDISASSSSSQFALRTPSPSPPPRRYPAPPRNISRIASPPSPSQTFRLVPTTLSDADAILFVPPATNPVTSPLSGVASISQLARQSGVHSNVDNSPCRSGRSVNKSQGLLLVGPAMNHLRGAKGIRTQIARGARVHPYKIVRNSGSTTAGGAISRTKCHDVPTPLVPVRDVSTVDFHE